MSADNHKTAILDALPKADRLRAVLMAWPAAVWSEIEAVVNTVQLQYRQYEAEARLDNSGTFRRDRYKDAAARLKDAHADLLMLRDNPYMQAPLGWVRAEFTGDDDDAEWIDWDQVERELDHAAAVLSGLSRWIALAQADADRAVIKNKPQSSRSRALDRLAYSLGLIYARATSKLPSFSADGATMFERFLISATKGMDLGVKKAGEREVSNAEAKAAIKRLDAKRNRSFRLDLNEPERDTRRTSEIFGEAVKRLGLVT